MAKARPVSVNVENVGGGAENRGKSEDILALEKKRIDLIKKANQQFASDETRRRKAEEAAERVFLKEKAKIEADQQKKIQRELLELQATGAEKVGDRLKANLQVAAQDAAKAIGDGLKNWAYGLGTDIKAYANQFAAYQASWNARLQGTEKTFQSINGIVTKNLATSPYVKIDTMLSNLNDLISQGIAYNVEQRAFLASVSDKIATTFDVSNAALLRLIRIQQADSTQARLGMEAYITNFLNKTYQDTTYLTNNARAVSQQLLEVSSNLSRGDAVELEYVVQKWLGSLSSVGASDSLITTLAAGINALGTGDLSYFGSNQALQNLFVMGASRSGVSYAEALTKGLKADAADAILKGIVSYLQDLAGTDNQVIKSTYANLFGTTVSDLNAVLNLVGDLDTIAGSSLSYSGATKELNRQLGLVGKRMHIGEQMSNLFDNMVSGIARGIANSPGMYATWAINEFIENATGGINIPYISALGTGVDLNANVNQLIKLGLVGFSTLGQIGNILESLGSRGGLNLGTWGYQDTTSRGTGFRGITQGASIGTSRVVYIGNASSSDIYTTTLAGAYSDANEVKKISDQSAEERENTEGQIKNIDQNADKMKGSLDNIDTNVASILSLLQQRLYYYNDRTA